MTAVALPRSPYKGLAAFEASDVDALFFFGRDRDSEVIAANLMASRLTVLFGPTGVGKTSVLRAGVAYRLQREPGVAVLVYASWTGDPASGLTAAAGGGGHSLLEALADAAARVQGDLYLILDQFEEYFLYHEGDQTFVQELASVVSRADVRVNVLIGIREDSLAELDAFKGLLPNLLSNRLRLNRLDRTEGEAAIVGPITRFNELAPPDRQVEIEPELTSAVLDEVAAGRVELGQAGKGVVEKARSEAQIEAPYLQLVMQRLWETEEKRGSRGLRRETLRALGGATQIVEDHLEHAMAEFSPRQKDVAAAMYNFLVTPTGTKIAHRVRDLAGYAQVDEAEAADVLRRLSHERIVRSGENGAATSFEIYHDVLADAVVAWRNRYEGESSVREAERRRRRAFAVAAAALAGLLLFAAIAVFALVERSRSKTEARRSHARELAAAATGELDADPQVSVRLAARAAELEGRVHEEDVLRTALLAANQRAVLRADGAVRVARFDPQGRDVVTGSEDGKVRIYRYGTWKLERVLEQGAPVVAAAYSPDGRLLLTAGRNGAVFVWAGREAPLHRLEAGGPVVSALFTHHGRAIVTVARNGVIRLWRTRDGRLVRGLRVHGKALPLGGAVSPSGRLVVTFGRDRFARVYSLETGSQVGRLANRGIVHCASFNPNGSLLMTCSHEGVVRTWSTATLRQVRVLRGPELNSAVVAGSFSPNGVLVAAAVTDGTARVWEAPNGLQIGVMFGHSNPVTAVGFNPAGKAIVTGGADDKARTWLTNGRPVALLAGHTGRVDTVEFSPDSRYVVTGSEDGTARIWHSGTEPDLALVARQAPITAFALSRDGRQVIVGDGHGVARVRPVGRRHPVSAIHVRGVVTAVAFGPRRPLVAVRPALSLAVSRSGKLTATGKSDGSIVVQGLPDGRTKILHGDAAATAVAFDPSESRLASGESTGLVRVWDLRSGRRRSLTAHRLAVTSISFSPDGSRLLTASRDGEARIWDVETLRLLHILRWHFGPLGGAAFSPDGRWVITAGPSTAGVGSAASGHRVLLLRAGPTRPLVGAGFGGVDGRLVVTASRDGTIRSYGCEICGDIGVLLRLARARLSAP